MKLRSGLKLSMKKSTNGTSTTRPMVTRLGRFVSSPRKVFFATQSPYQRRPPASSNTTPSP